MSARKLHALLSVALAAVAAVPLPQLHEKQHVKVSRQPSTHSEVETDIDLDLDWLDDGKNATVHADAVQGILTLDSPEMTEWLALLVDAGRKISTRNSQQVVDVAEGQCYDLDTFEAPTIRSSVNGFKKLRSCDEFKKLGRCTQSS